MCAAAAEGTFRLLGPLLVSHNGLALAAAA
jgi:hypothetical protein